MRCLKVITQHLAQTNIQPIVTVVMCISTLLFETLPCSTQIFAIKIMARAREGNHERNSKASTL